MLYMKNLLLIAALAMTFMAHAQTITIGEGSEMTTQTPFNTFYNYSFTEQIYHANEIEYAGNIKAIKFRIAYSYNSEHTSDILVYLKNVSKASFTDGSDYEAVTAEDLVFSGPWTIPANYDDWITIEFDTPFAYNGTDNLLIAIDENSPDYAMRYFRYTDATNTVLSYASDTQNPDPYDLPSFSDLKEVSSQRANIKLVFGGSVGVAEINSNILSAYPNPAKDLLYIKGADHEMVRVYDATGRLVLQKIYNGPLHIEGLERGLYTVITTNGSIKFMK